MSLHENSAISYNGRHLCSFTELYRMQISSVIFLKSSSNILTQICADYNNSTINLLPRISYTQIFSWVLDNSSRSLIE